MSFKMTLAGAALTLSLVPLAARAEHEGEAYDQYQYQQPTYEQQYQYQYQQPQQPAYQQPGIAVGEPDPTGRQDGGRGRYELRTVQRWVAGHYDQVWVPEQCSVRYQHWGRFHAAANVCVPGHYDQQWNPGHYESAQQWVWVPFHFHGHHRWERGFSDRGI